MPSIPANLGPLNVPGKFRFVPAGRTVTHDFRGGPARNPIVWSTEGEPAWSARIFVALVEGAPGFPGRKRTIGDVVGVVYFVRSAQTGTDTLPGDPGSTFMSDHGLYLSPTTGNVVDEPGVVVVIFKVPAETSADFKRNVQELAEIISAVLGQESVVLEVQKDGLTQFVAGVAASPEQRARFYGR